MRCSLRDVLRICASTDAYRLLLTKRVHWMNDTISSIRECCLSVNSDSEAMSGHSKRNLRTKIGSSKFSHSLSLIPDNMILLWPGSPKFAQKNMLGTECSETAQFLTVSMSYLIPGCATPVDIIVFRPMDELFLQACEKVKQKICKILINQAHSTRDDVEGTSGLNFSSPKHPNLLLSTNEEVYLNDKICDIFIGNVKYHVVRNPLRCVKLQLRMRPIVGCPMMPSYDLSNDEKISDEVQFHWYVGSSDSTLVRPSKNDDKSISEPYKLDGWIYRYSGIIFFPNVEDVGKKICVLMECDQHSPIQCTMSEDTVLNTSETFIFTERQSHFCANRTTHSLRLMTYNVLADLYLNLKENQEKLYFPYCPKEYQQYSYRYPILLKEIPGYNADVIFLQEVDERLWVRFLPPLMQLHGYECCFKRKGMKVNEGLVICYRTQQFKLLDRHDIWLTELLNTENFPENRDISDFVKADTELEKLFISRPTVLQLIVLSNHQNATTLLANTHLHFDPRHEIVKVLQALLCARYIELIAAGYQKLDRNTSIRVLFAGDFNSLPNSAVYQLLSSGTISDDECNEQFQRLIRECSSCIQQANMNNEKKLHGLKLKNLVDVEASNFTRHYRYDGVLSGFEGCLDYIWADDNLEVTSAVPLPSKELIKQYVALPSKACPSDHLPLICDVKIPHQI